MESDRTQLFVDLALSLLIALLVWRFYRERFYGDRDRYSTFWPRFWTSSVDSVILWPVGAIDIFLSSRNLTAPVFIPIYTMLILSYYAYSVLMHARYGQTVGKMVCKVRVVDSKTENKITFRQAFIRDAAPLLITIVLLTYQSFFVFTGKMSLSSFYRPENLREANGISFWLLLGIPGLWFFAEVLTMLTNDKRRALHDFLAGTVVIRTNLEDTMPNKAVQPTQPR